MPYRVPYTILDGIPYRISHRIPSITYPIDKVKIRRSPILENPPFEFLAYCLLGRGFLLRRSGISENSLYTPSRSSYRIP